MSSGFRERYVHFHQFNNWGVYPSDCYPSTPCKKPYIAFPRPLLNNVWLRPDPTECPKKLQSIQHGDEMRATDFKNLCSVSCTTLQMFSDVCPRSLHTTRLKRTSVLAAGQGYKNETLCRLFCVFAFKRMY